MRKMKRGLVALLLLILLLSAAGAAFLYYTVTHRVEGQYFDSAGTRIHYTVQGEGEPVVLVHGFAVNADLNWRRQGIIDALVEEFQVIAVDLRGHGLSGKPHGAEEYGVEMAEDIVRLLDHLKIEKAHVAGYSLGGFLTLNLAARHPERLRSAGVLGAGWEKMEESQFLTIAETLGEQLEAGEGVRPPSGMFGEDRPKPSFIHTAMVKILTRYFNDGLALAGVLRGAKQLALTEEDVRGIPVPMLVIIGTDDPLKVGCDNLKGRVQHLTTVEIPGADHIQAPRRPEFLPALQQFLREAEQ
jgi:pimeloyl-ACP methyl ester carboxylesterase